MKIENIILDDPNSPTKSIFGNDLCGRIYMAETPTDNWVVFLHGKGEYGPPSGVELHEVEKNEGFPKWAKGIRPGSSSVTGVFEFPFNILALQYKTDAGLPSGVYRSFGDWFVPRFSPRKWAIFGISMGSIYGQYQILKWSEGSKNIPDFSVSVCGTHSFPSSTKTAPDGTAYASSVVTENKKAYAASFPDVPGFAVHGDADPVVTYSSHKSFIDYYNMTHTNQILVQTIAGGDHDDAWKAAYKLPMETNALYNWTLAQFAAPTEFELATVSLGSKISSLRGLK